MILRARIPIRPSLLAVGLSVWLWCQHAFAFIHVVQPGDTLASIAETFYGKIQHAWTCKVGSGSLPACDWRYLR